MGRRPNISEKSARRFKHFFSHNFEVSHLSGHTTVMQHYCEHISTYRTEDPLMKNTILLAKFDISPATRAKLDERNKIIHGALPPLDQGIVVLYKPFEKPSMAEEDFASAILEAYLFGGKCRTDGSKITK